MTPPPRVISHLPYNHVFVCTYGISIGDDTDPIDIPLLGSHIVKGKKVNKVDTWISEALHKGDLIAFTGADTHKV